MIRLEAERTGWYYKKFVTKIGIIPKAQVYKWTNIPVV